MKYVITKYGLGDRAEIVKETGGHPFTLGTKVTIVGLPNQVNSGIYDSYYFCESDGSRTRWWVKEEYIRNIKEQSMNRKIKREDFKRIIACIPKTCAWYKELLLVFSDFTIKDELEVPEPIYIRGRRAADIPMNQLLDEIFGKDKREISNYDIVKNIAFNNLTNRMILPYAEELYYNVVINPVSGDQELKAEHKTRNDIYV